MALPATVESIASTARELRSHRCIADVKDHDAFDLQIAVAAPSIASRVSEWFSSWERPWTSPGKIFEVSTAR
jgi:hypothetical protein